MIVPCWNIAITFATRLKIINSFTTMKKIILNLLLISVLTINSFAQTSERPISLGLIGGLTQYNGDLGQGFYGSKKQPSFAHMGISFGWFVTSKVDFGMNLTYGSLGYYENAFKSFSGKQVQWNSHMKLYMFDMETHKFSPYLHGGIGFHVLKGENIPEGTDFFLPFGGGIRYKLNDRINLNLQETFMYTDHDDREGENRNNNDAFLMHSFGVSYNLNAGKDSDGDGVSDKSDKCPKTPSGVKVDKSGCPLDRDGDGIADVDDKCPDVKGVASAKGCPDKDGDGITDKDDKCPEVKGIVAMKGCPDADGDGITDAEDKCPDVKGTKELNGCVDTDGDGIIDPNDDCPTEKGLKELNGCPDKDSDGIADKDDKCPDVAGIAANKGCPEIKEEVKQLFTKALQGIQFETGKDVITKGSYAILDNVVKVMVENPAYLLDINGHTDNVGDSNKNKTLSQNRANAVLNYLVSKGVASSRLKATGFGDTIPVGDNKTAAGKAKNRRVEFKVNF